VEADDPEPSDAEDEISPWHAVNEREAAAFEEVQDHWGEVQKAMDSEVTFQDFVSADDYTVRLL